MTEFSLDATLESINEVCESALKIEGQAKL